jgi:hypothetical protein
MVGKQRSLILDRFTLDHLGLMDHHVRTKQIVFCAQTLISERSG